MGDTSYPYSLPMVFGRDARKEIGEVTQFRAVIETDSGLIYPNILSGGINSSSYPFTIPSGSFSISTSVLGETQLGTSSIRVDNNVRIQMNHKTYVGEIDSWTDIFHGKVTSVSSSFSTRGSVTTVSVIGHEQCTTYTTSPAISVVDYTSGDIIKLLIPSMLRLTDENFIDTAYSTEFSTYDVKTDAKDVMDVIRNMESLELYTYRFTTRAVYNSDGTLLKVLPIWYRIPEEATNNLQVNEGSRTLLSADFKSHIDKMRNKVTIYGDGVSGTKEDITSQNNYDVRDYVAVDRSIVTAGTCELLADSYVKRWKDPVITGTVTVRGNPNIVAGDKVRCRIPSIVVNGVSIDGTFLVRKVSHTFGIRGFTTTLILGEVDINMGEIISSFVLSGKRNNLNGI